MKNVLTHLSHQIQMYTVSQKKCLPVIILLCSLVKNEPIYIIFGTENPEDIWRQFLYSCPPYLKCHHTTLWNAELFTSLKLYDFPPKFYHCEKTASCYVFQKLELQTTSVEGPAESHYRMSWNTFPVFDINPSPCSSSIHFMSQWRADVADVHVMLF